MGLKWTEPNTYEAALAVVATALIIEVACIIGGMALIAGLAWRALQ